MSDTDRGILEYIKWCIETGNYYDEEYSYYLKIGKAIIKKWEFENISG